MTRQDMRTVLDVAHNASSHDRRISLLETDVDGLLEKVGNNEVKQAQENARLKYMIDQNSDKIKELMTSIGSLKNRVDILDPLTE